MRKVDKDEDGKVSYREFVKAVHLVSKIQDKPPSSSSKTKKSNFQFMASPSPKKSGSGQRPSSSKSPMRSKVPAKNSTPNSALKYKNFTPKKQLSDQDYRKYLNTSTKTDSSEQASFSKRNDQEKSQNLWPAESNSELIKKSSYYKMMTPQKGKTETSTRSKKPKQKTPELRDQKIKKTQTPLKDGYSAKKDSYVLQQMSFTPKQERFSPKQRSPTLKETISRIIEKTPKQERHSPKQERYSPRQDKYSPRQERYSPKQSHDPIIEDFTRIPVRSSSKTRSVTRKDYDLPLHQRDNTPIKAEVKQVEQVPNYREGYRRDRITEVENPHEVRVDNYSGYKARRAEYRKQELQKETKETEEKYDYTGYRETLGKNSPPSERQELKSYREPNQSATEAAISFDEKDSRWKNPSYKTPRKEGQEEQGESSQRKPPSEFVISPRKERSPPGKYLRAKNLSQKPSIKGYEEQFLAKAIKTVIDCERELQDAKKDLANQKDFSTMGAFRKFINKEAQDTTNQQQFEENLRSFGIFFTKTEAAAVFSKFDKDGDGIIGFRDFEHVVVPTNREFSGKLRERDPREELGDNSVKLFINFVKKFASIEAQLEDLRLRISKRFSLEDAFKAIDTREKGSIDAKEIKEILVYHGVFPTEKDIQNVISKMDTNNDGKLSVQEFTRSFNPQRSTARSSARTDRRESDKSPQTAEENKPKVEPEMKQESSGESLRQEDKPIVKESKPEASQDRENENVKNSEDRNEDKVIETQSQQEDRITVEPHLQAQPETQEVN